MRVLVYDSSKDIRDDFVNVLLADGFEIITVKHIKDIAKMAALVPINVAILEVLEEDIEMMALLAKMKSEDKYADIKVIVNASLPTKEFIAGMMQMGVDGFLLKPLKKHNLLERFKSVLNKIDVEIKHLNVMEIKVKESDSLMLSFRTNKGQVITNVATISAKELSFRVSKDSGFMIGESLSSIQFDMSGTRFLISAVVKNIKDRRCILRFEYITEKCLYAIYKYIHEAYMNDIISNKGCVR